MKSNLVQCIQRSNLNYSTPNGVFEANLKPGKTKEKMFSKRRKRIPKNKPKISLNRPRWRGARSCLGARPTVLPGTVTRTVVRMVVRGFWPPGTAVLPCGMAVQSSNLLPWFPDLHYTSILPQNASPNASFPIKVGEFLISLAKLLENKKTNQTSTLWTERGKFDHFSLKFDMKFMGEGGQMRAKMM